MNILMLLAAFVLPWTAAFLAMRALEYRLGVNSHILRQLGTSYFLGLFALHGIVYLDSLLFGEVHTRAILALIAAGAGITALLSDARGTVGREGGTSQIVHRGSYSGMARLLLLCLLALIVAHLVLTTLEASYRPIYPWDAWQTWMYRAKAWFYNGHIFAFAGTHEWLKSGEITFNSPGHAYPPFTSIMAFWAASALGRWSETLVNLPVILAGWALALSVYGHCRESGVGRLTALAAVFMLVSIPLLGTHLALAGQADIWMVGFCGLGLVGVLRGLSESDAYQLASGLLLCACSALVKFEGAVWVSAACAICVITYRPRLAILLGLIAGGLLILIISRFATGSAEDEHQLIIDLPILGELVISRFAILDDYFDHLFLFGSWNILWYLVLASVFIVAIAGRGRLRLTLLGFYLTVLGSQAIIFGFTEHGRWAEDGTALNRLLLQTLPAWIFSLVLVKHRLADHIAGDSLRGLKVLLAATLAALLVAAGITGLFYFSSPQDQRKTLDVTSRLFPVRGTASSGDSIRITGYQGGLAILSSGRTYIEAESMPMLAVTLDGTFARDAGFFWRGEGADGQLETIKLGGAGVHRIDLSEIDDWEGKITELGLTFYDDGTQGDAAVTDFTLQSPTIANRMATTWSDWTRQEYWSQTSVNWLAGGSRDQATPMTAVVGAWLACALLILLLLPGSWRAKGSASFLLVLVAWLLMDLRWLVNSGVQLRETIAFYSGGADRGTLDIDQDGELATISRFLHSELPQEPVPLIITSSEGALRFQLQRSKYRLLPHPAVAYIGELSDMPPTNAQALIVLDTEALGGQPRAPVSWRDRLALKRIFGTNAIGKTSLPGDAGYLWRDRDSYQPGNEEAAAKR